VACILESEDIIEQQATWQAREITLALNQFDRNSATAAMNLVPCKRMCTMHQN